MGNKKNSRIIANTSLIWFNKGVKVLKTIYITKTPEATHLFKKVKVGFSKNRQF